MRFTRPQLIATGHLLLNLEQVEAARRVAARVGDGVPDDLGEAAGLSSLRGRLAAQAGLDDVAEAALLAAVALEPEEELWVGALTEFLVERGRVADAVAAIEAALPIARDTPWLLQIRATLARAL